MVPLGGAEEARLTLAEWDALVACERVWFEDATHPLRARLEESGTVTAPLGDVEPGPGTGVVCNPDSTRLAGFAELGATITAGAADPPDARTAAIGAPIGRRASAALAELALVMARLRGPGGCPWDHEQTHESLQVHLLEEAHEVLEAIDRGALGEELQEELGDLLLQVVFHAQMAADDGRFDLEGVARGLVAKLIYRHPHVFADTEVAGASEVIANWEQLKAAERDGERDDPFAGIPASLPALLATYKTQKRAAGLGFEADPSEARGRVHEALEAGDVGDALFWLVAVARAAGVDPEGALRKATARFAGSF